MHLIRISTGKLPASAALIVVSAALGLTACGGSSSSTSTNASASAQSQGGTAAGSTTAGNGHTGAPGAPAKEGPGGGSSGSGAGHKGQGSTGPGRPGATAAGAVRFAKVRECLQKQGITLPGVRPGGPNGPPRGPLDKGSRPQLPKGMTQAQYEAAVHRCGGFGRGRFFGGGARLKNPAFKAALTKFAECLRKNGVQVPAPNTSGSGPIFDTKGIDTQSAQFKAAQMKCAGELRGTLGGAHPGAAGGSPSR